MSLSSLNSIGQTVFELESANENVDGQTDGQTNRQNQTKGQTNGQNYTNFKRNLAMMVIYAPVKFEFDWTNKSPETKMWMDRQTNGQKMDK